MVVHGSSSEEELDDIIPTAMAPTDGEDGPGSELEEACLDVA